MSIILFNFLLHLLVWQVLGPREGRPPRRRRKRDDKVRELRRKGVPVRQLAEMCKLGRQAVYKILRRGRLDRL
ncbi:MAG: helix-turn-helix domain-containing protein [Dehalococcoidia bacterium]|jgi:DNA invertase Pin-like site-specific DNA recombinase